jgi:hypothetical protein
MWSKDTITDGDTSKLMYVNVCQFWNACNPLRQVAQAHLRPPARQLERYSRWFFLETKLYSLNSRFAAVFGNVLWRFNIEVPLSTATAAGTIRRFTRFRVECLAVRCNAAGAEAGD